MWYCLGRLQQRKDRGNNSWSSSQMHRMAKCSLLGQTVISSWKNKCKLAMTIAFPYASTEPVQFYHSFSDLSNGPRVLFAFITNTETWWAPLCVQRLCPPRPRSQRLKAHLIGGVSEQGHGEQTPEPISTVFVSHAKEVVRNTLSPSLMSYFRTRTNSLQGWILLSENLLKSVHVPSDTDWHRWTVVLHPT